MTTTSFDVIIVGGGIAGSALGGVLARGGLGVLVVEKEPRFRDRIRGEGTYPWGVAAALTAGLGDLLATAGCVDLVGVRRYEQRQLKTTYYWKSDSIDGIDEIGFLHPRLQEAAFAWAEAQGATTRRPAKATTFSHNGKATLTVAHDGGDSEYTARLVVGADGKSSMARRWTGGEAVADPEHHRFGGVLVSGVTTDDRDTDNLASHRQCACNWFAAGPDYTRLYLQARADWLRQHGADRSFEAILAVAKTFMPEGALDEARQEGPIGFFPNNDVWASRVAGNDVALIGDAAGAPDPSQGHGTCLLFRDVRELSEALLSEPDWRAAIAGYAERRARYFDVILQYDRWNNILELDEGDDADRLRESHERAKEADPTLGGFELIAARGPDGLVADDGARRMYFGES
jgi:2-polyprenyl-6-methoxyphenol hydroxylase-like FAD-dependent oxidoreductase